MGKQTWKGGNMLNPVPAVMVSVADSEGKTNIITIAWAGTVCTNPPMVSISVRPERYSCHILEETGEFVINLTTRELVRACDYCGVVSGRDHDKFREMQLTPCRVEGVEAPAIAESPVNLACKVEKTEKLGSHIMFIARVVSVTVDEGILDDTGKLCLNGAGLVCYSHGEYFLLGENLGKFGYSIRKEISGQRRIRGEKKRQDGKAAPEGKRKPDPKPAPEGEKADRRPAPVGKGKPNRKAAPEGRKKPDRKAAPEGRKKPDRKAAPEGRKKPDRKAAPEGKKKTGSGTAPEEKRPDRNTTENR